MSGCGLDSCRGVAPLATSRRVEGVQGGRSRGDCERRKEGVGHGLRDAILFPRAAQQSERLFAETYEAGQGAGRAFRRDSNAPREFHRPGWGTMCFPGYQNCP